MTQLINYDEIALEGASLIDEYFSGSAETVLLWSPRSVLPNTALVFGDLWLPDGFTGRFQRLLRQFFQRAGVRELSHVEYFDGGGDPIWAMLVEYAPQTDLPVGVHLCNCAALSWSIRKALRIHRYSKRRLDPVLKLLVPGYPDCDLKAPLDQLVLPPTTKRGRGARSASGAQKI